MKNLSKTFLVALITCLFSVTTNAHDFEVGGIYYNILSERNKRVEVTYKGTNSSSAAYIGSITIPSSVVYNNTTYSVTRIGWNAFSNCSSLTTIVIPNSVTSVESSAFFDCTKLPTENNVIYADKWAVGVSNKTSTSYILRSNTVGIAVGTFNGCNSMSSITIPNGVTSIGIRAFADCNNLTSVEIPSSVTSIDGSAFSGCTKLPIANNVIYADKWAVGVSDKTSTSYTLRSNTVGIASNIFEQCTSMTSISIPSSVSFIGSMAFPYSLQTISYANIEQICRIENLNLSTGVKRLVNGAEITDVVIPNTVTRIGTLAFAGSLGIRSITIPNSVTSIGYGAFMYNNISSLNIPKSVTNIEPGALRGTGVIKTITVAEDNPVYDSRENCNAIIVKSTNTLLAGCSSTIIPNSVTKIEDEAFAICGTLSAITIPERVTSIGFGAFAGCNNLTSVEIPSSVTSIGEEAFSGCSNMTSVAIPSSVTKIGNKTFSLCFKLASIVCHNPIPPTCGTYVFGSVPTSTCKLIVPASSVESYSSTAPWSSFTNIEALPTPEITLTDGETYNNSTEQEYDKITYTRTLPNLHWNCLYVPFEIPYEDLAEDYDVAYINGMHSYDTDDNGEIDKLTMEWIKIKQGTLKANYPYLIKAKSDAAKNMTLVQENAILYPAESTTLDCASIYTKFEITGTYQPISEEDMDGRLAISLNGIWEPSTGLKANRFYLTITERGDAPVKISEEALSRISNIVIGDDSATGIEDAVQETSKQNGTTYDLSGRRVQKPAKGGVYIVNGKKVVF